jgi:hypothetical protein|tara:strand:- start:237 stop:770 length:534 start_codon:yes stop_codon:yes gene_type:complete
MKKINPDVIDLLKECNVGVESGLGYLLCLANNFVPVYIPERLKQMVHSTGIVIYNKEGITWRMPLFKEQATEFGWLEEWRELFKPFGTHNKNKKEVALKMKAFFSENPHIRVEEVMGATKMYVAHQIKEGYPRQPHYFITKGRGLDKISDLTTWVDEYKESNTKNDDEGYTLTNSMQ